MVKDRSASETKRRSVSCRAARLVFALAGCFSLLLSTADAQPALSLEVMQQIEALQQEKASWSPAEGKISTKLLLEAKDRVGRPMAAGLPRLRSRVELDSQGNVEVDIKARVTPALLARISALGGNVINHFSQYGAIRATVPLTQVLALADEEDVTGIRPALPYVLNKTNTSEGDVAHRAALGRSTFAADGTGVTVGVISDSIESLAALQASGDLPATVNVISGQSGTGTSEGTAMLEIVHDLAPGAALWFATANGGEAQFASNILALRAAGCNVIVDDVGYFAEYVFQDGVIGQAVDTVTAAGAAYFSSAGNSGNLNDGTSGVWEGDYVSIAPPAVLSGAGGNAHNFGGGLNYISISGDSPSYFILKWSDAGGASGNDYDLYLLNAARTGIYDASTNVQNGNDDPIEWIDSTSYNDVGNTLVIIKKTAAASRMLHLNANRGRLSGGTAGQIYGHSGAAGCITVAAVDVSSAAGPGGVFNGTESIEYFSSDGPRRVHYNAAGSPITPGNFSSTGGTLRQKPDITAADGVATATPGFDPFYGTSAAAPHAAAIAALLIDRGIATSPTAIRQKMADTALDIEAAGIDRDSGAGITDAYDALYGPPSTVDAHSSPQADRDLPDWNDTEPEKMSVLKFRVTDQGEDGMATLIDRIIIGISGTAGQAANDIAWAELHDGTVQVATAASITDAQIVFGAAPNSDSAAQLDAVPDDAYVEYTVNLYLNPTLLGQHDETYVFDVDETNIGVDGGSSSLMATDSGTVTPVTGTLFVTALGVTVTPDTWTIGPQPLNYIAESGTFTLQNTGNVSEDVTIMGSDGGNGWQLQGAAGPNAFRVEADKDDNGSYETVLTTSEQTFATDVVVSGTETFGLKYSGPSNDTLGAGLAQDFTVTLKVSRHAP